MFKVAIRPQWEVRGPQGQPLPPRLIELLVAVAEHRQLAEACRQTGLSYRYAWGLLRDVERDFGVPLLRATRGPCGSSSNSGARARLERRGHTERARRNPDVACAESGPCGPRSRTRPTRFVPRRRRWRSSPLPGPGLHPHRLRRSPPHPAALQGRSRHARHPP